MRQISLYIKESQYNVMVERKKRDGIPISETIRRAISKEIPDVPTLDKEEIIELNQKVRKLSRV